jgi:hypothetical protein
MERHAAGGEPLDGVAGLEAVEGADERPAAAGVMGGQFARVEAGVGDIAASATRNADLGEELGTLPRIVMVVTGAASAQAMAAKKPAAPPPTTMTCRALIG